MELNDHKDICAFIFKENKKSVKSDICTCLAQICLDRIYIYYVEFSNSSKFPMNFPLVQIFDFFYQHSLVFSIQVPSIIRFIPKRLGSQFFWSNYKRYCTCNFGFHVSTVCIQKFLCTDFLFCELTNLTYQFYQGTVGCFGLFVSKFLEIFYLDHHVNCKQGQIYFLYV